MAKYLQGKYKPSNPKKYRGDISNIQYRSSWELTFMRYLDTSSNVLSWNSEEVIIPYYSELDGRSHRYFLDFAVEVRDREGNKNVFLVEIKPKAQTIPPKKPKKIGKRYIKEVTAYVTNQAKWKAADKFATDNGMKFIVLTENEIYGKNIL